ncbi:keratin type II cytoskeletal [Acrasis kona]|uniref:Keratin type II cytoskeletal n=1 Tax=Acrasis kona TaxID=1008807 RepID=A0AAW2ZDW4_9EUKA
MHTDAPKPRRIYGHLLVKNDSGEQKLDIYKEGLMIGSDENVSDFVIKNVGLGVVNARHAEIFIQLHSHKISVRRAEGAMDSTLLVNGRAIQSVELKNNDEITIGVHPSITTFTLTYPTKRELSGDSSAVELTPVKKKEIRQDTPFPTKRFETSLPGSTPLKLRKRGRALTEQQEQESEDQKTKKIKTSEDSVESFESQEVSTTHSDYVNVNSEVSEEIADALGLDQPVTENESSLLYNADDVKTSSINEQIQEEATQEDLQQDVEEKYIDEYLANDSREVAAVEINFEDDDATMEDYLEDDEKVLSQPIENESEKVDTIEDVPTSEEIQVSDKVDVDYVNTQKQDVSEELSDEDNEDMPLDYQNEDSIVDEEASRLSSDVDDVDSNESEDEEPTEPPVMKLSSSSAPDPMVVEPTLTQQQQEQHLKKLENSLSSLQHEHDALVAKAKLYEEELVDLQEHVLDLERQKTEQSDYSQKLKEKISSLKRDKAQLQQDIKTVETELDNVESQLTDLEETHQNELDSNEKTTKGLRDEIELLKKSHSTRESDLTKRITNLNQKLLNMETSQTNLKADLEKEKKGFQQIEQEYISELSRQKQELKKQYEEHCLLEKQLYEQIAALKDRHEDDLDRVVENDAKLHRYNLERQSLKERLSLLESEVNAQEAQEPKSSCNIL